MRRRAGSPTITFSSWRSDICPWPTPMRSSGTIWRRRIGRLVDRLDPVVQVERLAAAVVLAHAAPCARAPRRTRRRGCGSGRRPRGGVAMTEMSRRPESDMCSVRGIGVARQRQHVDLGAQLAQQLLLGDAEALLLVDDDEPEVARHDVAREHAVGADEDVDLALAEVGHDALDLASPCGSARSTSTRTGTSRKRSRKVGDVLLGEDRGRYQHQHLAAAGDDLQGRADRDLGLAEADVAADQAVHRPRATRGRS